MLSSLISLNSGHFHSLLTVWTRTLRHFPRGGVVVHPNRPDDELFTLDDEIENNIDELGDLMNPSQHDRGHIHRKLTHGKNKSVEKLHAEFVKKKIIEKKEKKFYNPKKPNLLTWAARMQIKHLNQEDPIYWTPEMLANSFPASIDDVKQILKNNRLPINEAEIGRHDKTVYNNWLKLKEVSKMMEEGADLNDEEEMLVRNGKNVLHLLTHAAGNTSVPVPPSMFAFRTQEQIAEENKPVVKPVFSSILTSYEHDKEGLKNELKVEETKPIGFNVNSVRLLLEGIAHSTDTENSHERGDSETDDASMVRASGHFQGHKTDDESMVRASDHFQGHKTDDESMVRASGHSQGNKTDDESMVRASGHSQGHKTDDESMFRASGPSQGYKTVDVSVVPMLSDPTHCQKQKTINVSNQDVSMIRPSSHTNSHKADHVSIGSLFGNSNKCSNPKTVKISDHDVSMVRDSGPIRNQTMLRKPTHQLRHNNNISKLQDQSDDDNQVRLLFSDNSKNTTTTSGRKTSRPDKIQSRDESIEQASQPDDIKSRVMNNFRSQANSIEKVGQRDKIKSSNINNFKSPATSSKQEISEIISKSRTNFNSPANSSEHTNLDANHVEVMPLFRTEQQGGSNKRWDGRSSFEMADKTERQSVDQQAGSESENYLNKYKRLEARSSFGMADKRERKSEGQLAGNELHNYLNKYKRFEARSSFEMADKRERKSVYKLAGSESDKYLNKFKRKTKYTFNVKRFDAEFSKTDLDKMFDEASLSFK